MCRKGSHTEAMMLWRLVYLWHSVLCGQGFEILIASNHLENLFDGDFAEGDKRGRSHQSALFVFDGSDRWHKIGHSVVV